MVADESAVLPDARAVDSDDDESPFAFEDQARSGGVNSPPQTYNGFCDDTAAVWRPMAQR